jgi:energy-coupling factor transporter ATP-binding protein EcfA2
MKITNIQLCNFGTHAETELAECGGVNLVTGTNGSGKSTILDSFRYAWTGRARGTDARGANAEVTVRFGQTRSGVALAFADGSEIFRGHDLDSRTGRLEVQVGGLTAQDAAANPLLQKQRILDPDMIECLLNMPLAFLLPPATRSDLLGGLVSVRLTIEEFLGRLQDHVSMNDEVVRVAVRQEAEGALREGTDLRDDYRVDLPVMAWLRKFLYDRRTEWGRRKQDLEVIVGAGFTPGPDDITLKMARLTVLRCTEEKEQNLEARGGLQERADELEAKRQEIEDIQASINLLAEAANKPRVSADPERLALQTAETEEAAAREAHGRAAKAHEEAVEAANSALEALLKAREVRDPLAARYQALKAGSFVCDGSFAKEKTECPVMKARAQETAETAQKVWRQLTKADADVLAKQNALEEATAKFETAKTDLRKRSQSVLQAKATVSEAWQALKEKEKEEARGAGVGEGELASARQRLLDVQAVLEDLGNPKVRLDEVNAHIAELDSALAAAQKHVKEHDAAVLREREFVQNQEALTAASARWETVDLVVKALDPKALPARLAQERMEPLAGPVGQYVSDLTGGRWTAEFVVSAKGLDLQPVRRIEGSEYRIPIQRLSKSELIRFGLALTAAVSHMTGFRLLAIDDAESIVGEDQDWLIDTCENLVNGGILDQVWIFAASWEGKAVPWARCFHMSGAGHLNDLETNVG